MSEASRAAWRASGGARRKSAVKRRGLAVGVALSFDEPLAARTEAVAATIEAFLSPTWGLPLRHLMSQTVEGRPHPRTAGPVPVDERRALLDELLGHPDLWEVTLATAAETGGDYATLSVETRPRLGHARRNVVGRRWLDESATPDADAWVDAMLTFAARTGARHGVVPVMNDAAVLSDTTLSKITIDGVVQHPLLDELERMRAVAPELDSRYLRFPRWGTIYPRRPLDALGGEARIRDAVEPAVVRDLGEAIYVQLTDSLATATAPEALDRQRRFTELVAPLLPGPR